MCKICYRNILSGKMEELICFSTSWQILQPHPLINVTSMDFKENINATYYGFPHYHHQIKHYTILLKFKNYSMWLRTIVQFHAKWLNLNNSVHLFDVNITSIQSLAVFSKISKQSTIYTIHLILLIPNCKNSQNQLTGFDKIIHNSLYWIISD